MPVAGRPGVSATPLYEDARERVRLETWEPGTILTIDTDGGAELLVLDGAFEESGETFGRHAWLRLPEGADAVAKTGPEGARVWIKSGHLCFAAAPEPL